MGKTKRWRMANGEWPLNQYQKATLNYTMGIAGLTTFINRNPTLLEHYKLHDTRVVLDGNNLLHVLYYDYHTNHRYCGNYDQFAKNIEHYFGAFFTCYVKPVIVFDGGYETDDRKLRTTLRRAQERIHLAGFISHGGSGRILPVLAEVTFKNVLAKLGVPHVTCDFEADDQLAALANDWGCPVISNDSDFFVFNLRGGFIPLDRLDGQVTTNSDGTKYLDTQIYRIETFVKHFKCPDVNFVPLFATLLGNDFVDGRKFENFFANIKLPRTKSKRFTIPTKYTKMAGLLLWLEDMESVEDALELVLQYFKKEDRDHFKKIILRSVASYTKIASKLQDIFENSKSDLSKLNSVVKSHNGINLPAWFLNEFRCGNLSVNLFNALVLHRVIPLCQVEDMGSDSAYQCCCDIRHIVYGILLLHEKKAGPPEITKTDGEMKAPRANYVEEYTRVEKKLTKHCIEPTYILPSGDSLPALENIPRLSSEMRTSVLFEALGLKASDCRKLPNELQLVMASIVYWLRTASPRVTKGHLQGLLISILKLSCIEPIMSKLVANDNSDELKCDDGMNDLCKKIVNGCTAAEIKAAKQRLDKTVSQPHLDIICADVVHGFAQWHACLLCAVHLNQLLLRPLSEPRPALIYNGSVAYAFCKELTLRKDPGLYVSEVLGRRTVISEVYTNLLQFCLGHVDEEIFHVPVSTRKKGSKRSRRKEAKGKGRKPTISAVGTDIKGRVVEHLRSVVDKQFDLNNKFGMLALSDDSIGENSADDL